MKALLAAVRLPKVAVIVNVSVPDQFPVAEKLTIPELIEGMTLVFPVME